MNKYFVGPTKRGKQVSIPAWKRYALLVMFTVLFSASALYAQESGASKINKPMMVKELLNLIQDSTDYRFFYSDGLEDMDKKIVLDADISDIKAVIKELEEKTSLHFEFLENKLIIVNQKKSNQPAQKIKGKVTSELDPVGLVGVNVYTKETLKGTVTDIDGNYSIDASPGDILVFSFIGFLAEEITVTPDTKQLDVTLVPNLISMDEVVVTALNISRDKSSLGYSVTQINNEELTNVPENNPFNSLAGKVAGLQISGTPSGVDGSTRVVLRGITSIAGDNRPLIVIDGIPVDGSSYGGVNKDGGIDRGDALSDINPSDIQSMSVLKGAGAAAAYGSRGANGVIIITTKNGTGNKGLGVSINSSLIFENPLLIPELQNQFGQGAHGSYPTEYFGSINEIKGEEPWVWSWGAPMEGQILPDWLGNETSYSPQPNQIKEFYQTGVNLSNSVAFDAGGGGMGFRASITNQNNTGIYPGNKMNKQTINLRGFSKFGKALKLDGKLVYVHNKVEGRPYLNEDAGNPVWALGTMPRNITLASLKANTVDENGKEMWVWDKTVSNPYWVINNRRNNDEKHRIQSFFSLGYDINERLDFQIRSGMDITSTQIRQYAASGSREHHEMQGFLEQAFSIFTEWNSDVLLNYNQPIGNNFNVNISFGGNYRYNIQKNMSQGGYKWKAPDFYHLDNLATFWTKEMLIEKEVLSGYSLGTLTFKDYLYLDLTFRRDWSSTLPKENNAYDFYSTNISYLFTDAFKINSDILSKGKIRGSIAKVGNDAPPYQTMNYYDVEQSNLSYPVGGMPGRLAIEGFKPEITTSWELGMELAFFNNKINLDAAFYNASTKNQILSVQMAPSSGFSSKVVNAGEVRNYGVEGLISASVFESNNGFSWDASLNITKNINEVVSLTNDQDSWVLETAILGFAILEMRVGEPYGSLYGYDYQRNEKGEKLINDNGSPLKTEERVKLGDINPDLTGGFSNHFNFKNINLNFLVDFQLGGEFYSQGALYRDLFGTSASSVKGREEWYSTHEGFLNSEEISGVIPKGYVEDGVNVNTGMKNDVPVKPIMRYVNTIYFDKIVTDYIKDATNIRMRELSIGYTLPIHWFKDVPIKKINISLVGRNLFFFYNAAGDIDPESGYSSGNYGNAFEMNAMPTTRSYGFNLSLNF